MKKKYFFYLCLTISLIFSILLCSHKKMDYSHFLNNGTLIYVMEHNDKTKEEFEEENQRYIEINSKNNFPQEMYRLLTPSIILYTNKDGIYDCDFVFGNLFSITSMEKSEYEIIQDEKLLILKFKTRNNEFIQLYFRIINNNTLRFISEKSSDIKKFEDKSFISLSDDALFFLEKE